MGGRTGVGKAVAWGAVVAVVGLLLCPGSVVPPIPGRPPTTSSPDPASFSFGGPPGALPAFQVEVADLDLEEVDTTAAAELGPLPELFVSGPLPDSFAGGDSLDRIAEVGREGGDGGEVRSGLDGSASHPGWPLAPIMLALIVLKAVHDQDQDRRRLRTATPASRSPARIA